MTKPTREAILKNIEWAKNRQKATDYDERILWAKIQFAWELILAQEEELNKYHTLIQETNDRMVGMIELVEKLKADNQAQEEELKRSRDLLGDTTWKLEEAEDSVMKLEAENQALRADIEKHEKGYGYLLATGQVEREEMRKRNRREAKP